MVRQGFKVIPPGPGQAFHAADSAIWHLQQFTVDAWVRATPGFDTAPDGIGEIVAVKVLTDLPHVFPFNSWWLSYEPTFSRFGAIVNTCYVSGVGADYLHSAPLYPPGQFHHVAMTYDGQTLKLYVNGAFDAQKLCPGPIAYSDKRLGIAGHAIGGPGTVSGRNLVGEVDEVEIFNRPLDVSEIRAIFLAGAAGKCKIAVSIDIKPGSDPNCFNNDGKGTIPVAILGSPTFNVGNIDPESVQLNGLAIKVAGRSNNLLAHIEDVNADGFLDLVVQIQDADGAFSSGTGTATLIGRLTDGRGFYGVDSICIVP